VAYLYQWPIQPPPTSTRGQKFGALRGGRPHTGLDLGQRGETVLAAADGVVRYAGDTHDSRGIAVAITHASLGTETRYYHLAKATTTKGAVVRAGDPIGVVGMTGLPRPWPHLHFEVVGSIPQDPELSLPPHEPYSTAGVLPAAVLLWLARR
jgi:murein DD-endopeptidase MepM/ murein hydrolase activator NlpD